MLSKKLSSKKIKDVYKSLDEFANESKENDYEVKKWKQKLRKKKSW